MQQEKKLAIIVGKHSKTLRRAALKYSNLNYDILLIASNIDIHAEVKYIRKCGFKCHCIQVDFASAQALEGLIDSLQNINQTINLVVIYQDISKDLTIEDKIAKAVISNFSLNGEGKIIMAKERSNIQGPFISKELIVRAFVNGIMIEGANY